MNDREKISTLQRLKQALQGEVLRSGAPLKMEHFAELWDALSFNAPYCMSAKKASEVLLTPGLAQAEYEQAETELNMILGQAISELTHGIKPIPVEVLESGGDT